MLNVNLLRAEWVKKGLNQGQVAEMLGICDKTFGMKLKKGVLNSDQIEKLIAELEIADPMPIFFAKEVS